MSLKATIWAWSVPAGGHDGLSPSSKLLLMALANYADDEGLCWPSVARLVTMTGLGERTVRRLLPDLVETGLMAMEKQEGRNTRYVLHIGAALKPMSPRQGCHHGRGANGAGVSSKFGLAGVPNATERGATMAPEPKGTPKEEVPPGRDLPVTARVPAPLPLGWLPSEADEAFAVAAGLDPMTTSETFRDWYHGNGECRADWSAVWRTWCRNQRRFDDRDAARAGRVTFSGFMAQQRARGVLDADDFADITVPPARRLDS
jgi:hypothetical protein